MKQILLAAALCVYLTTPAEAAITFFGVASTPADNGSNGDEPIAITPPASMAAGDLVYVVVSSVSGGITWSVSADGDGCVNDSWTSLTGFTTSNPVSDAFWCVHDGGWAADPSFDPSGTGAVSTAVMLVFRPTSGSYTWDNNVALAFEDEAAGTTFTKTGQDPSGTSCVSVAMWDSDAATASTWGTLSGTGWSKTSLSAQYRNTNGATDVSMSFAYYIGSGEATGDVAQTQSQNVNGHVSMISFCETASVSTYRSLTGVGN